MDLQNRIKKADLQDLIDICEQLSKECRGFSNCLNTSPVVLAALAKECRAITDALDRLHELSRTIEGDTLVPHPGIDYVQTKDVAHELHHAIEQTDESAVFNILLERADPNITLAGSMLSPLHRAFDKKHMLIAAFLIVAGADVDEPTTDGDTALMRSIKCGFSEQFARLVIHMKVRINSIDNNGRSALHFSAASDVLEDETLPTLINAGADINLVDYEGHTPLHVAIQHAHWSAATKLVQAGADLEVRLPDGKTALHLTIAMRNQEFTQVLISRGANVDPALLDMGANPNLPSRNGNTPLLAAAATGHDETVRYLIAHGANPTETHGQSGYTPMHMAAHKDKPHILRLLAESEAPIDVLDRNGETPLLIAAKLGNSQSILRLVNLGADIERVGPDGMNVAGSTWSPSRRRLRSMWPLNTLGMRFYSDLYHTGHLLRALSFLVGLPYRLRHLMAMSRQSGFFFD
ncbi:hypothetical protein FGSG_02772 [Fusarium graminearum PH-1]|uniref:hypothetical protein n=1 Tax=Gibberella zeae (strain ATCC MYA-4620 / CBS 123657 / FGSC 9075 / NRRL 31084 / PH-1) TaxID=229533 RepID=UPI00021F13E3|nr:hypothetical protein FGSG_02772 [Fusarium graminearum PH-1]ESU08254.1 hypothetical protein FGSG_02772 [Fusarium graminearum PH-1]|eukprot:XP_011318739.1 hypothetical protein FGSG_02772 [Fusarium graminearum PH-1]